MSGRSGAVKETGRSSIGCVKPSVVACRAWRAIRGFRAQRVGHVPLLQVAAAVHVVAHDRVPQVREVDPDLMGPAGAELQFHQGVAFDTARGPGRS